MKQTIKFIELPEKKTIIAISDGLKAHSKCDERDEYDPEFGMQLARKRLLLKKSRADLAKFDKEEDYWFKLKRIADDNLARLYDKINYCLDKNFELSAEIAELIKTKED